MARLLPYLDRNLADLPGETWQNAYGFEGLYHVSNLGRIKSLARLNSLGRRVRAKIRSQFMSGKNSGMWVRLFADAVRHDVSVGPLVLNSFGVFAESPAHVAMHLNKTGSDNRLTNLCYASQAESVRRNWQMGLSSWSETAWDWREVEQATYTAQYVSVDTTGNTWILCIRCGAERPESDYAIPGRRRSRICHECRAMANGVQQVGLSRYKQTLREQGLKECTGCQQVKPLSEFYKQGSYQAPGCKLCTDAKRNRKRLTERNRPLKPSRKPKKSPKSDAIWLIVKDEIDSVPLYALSCKYDIPYMNLYRMAKRRGITPLRTPKPAPSASQWPDLLSAIRAASEEGLTTGETTQRLGITRATIYHYKNKYGLRFVDGRLFRYDPAKRPENPPITDAQPEAVTAFMSGRVAELASLRAQGLTAKEIAEQTGLAMGTVYVYLSRAGLTSSGRKCSVVSLHGLPVGITSWLI